MTQEEKQLLLKDLCARLPYGIKFPYHIDEDSNHRECDCVATMDTISEDTVEFTYDENGAIRDWSCSIKEVKPYLRSKTSISEEEIKTYQSLQDTACSYHYEFGDIVDDILYFDNDVSLDYLNSIHIDYRGLIPIGLALEAPEGMYKTEQP